VTGINKNPTPIPLANSDVFVVKKDCSKESESKLELIPVTLTRKTISKATSQINPIVIGNKMLLPVTIL
jgi:hypothetical protein